MGEGKMVNKLFNMALVRSVCVIAVLGGAGVALPAAAQDGAVVDSFYLDQMASRIDRLELDMQGLVQSGQIPAGGNYPAAQAAGASDEALAKMQIKLTALEEELASVTGKLEDAEFRIERLVEQLERMTRDTEFRLSALEQKTGGGALAGQSLPPEGAESGGAPVGVVPGAPPSKPADSSGFQLPAGSAAEQYNYAIGLLRNGAYGDAEMAFTAFVDQNGADPLAANAQYWLGESYYVRDMHKDAAKAFLQGLKTYPNGAKAPDSMLKLGMSLVRLGQTKEACVALGSLDARYPDASPKVKARAQTERKKAGCV